MTRWDWGIEGLLYALLAFMPFAFGAVQAWSEQVVILLTTAITFCLLAKAVTYRHWQFLWTWAYIPIVIFLAIPILQMLQLPIEIIRTISPNTAMIKAELMEGLPGAERMLHSITLSFYPHATAAQFRILLAITCVFFVVAHVFRRRSQIKRLLLAVTIIGAAVALLAVTQVVTGAEKIYWQVPVPRNAAVSGPFVNASHYAQFMNLSIGAGLAFLLVMLHEAFTGRKLTVPTTLEFIESDIGKRSWLLVGFLIIAAASIFLSLSRGGMISTLIAATLTTVLVTSRHSVRGKGWLICLMALGAFICVLYIGFESVYDRLAALRDLQKAQGGRVQILKDVVLAWTKYPVLGTGLGTHEVVYPMFDRATVPTLAAHAENEYAQAAEETGFVGVSALVLLGAVVWRRYFRCIYTAQVPIRSAAYGLGFGLIAILIHSLSDFGQHLPANATLTAIFCGLLIALSDPGRSQRGTASGSDSKHRIGIAVLMLMVGMGTWNTFQANNARLAEKNWNHVQRIASSLEAKDWQGNDFEYVDLICNAAEASRLEPTNVHYAYWLNVYRWKSVNRYLTEGTASTIPPQTRDVVEKLIAEFQKVTLLCPTYGPAYCVLGQLEQFQQFTLSKQEEPVFGEDPGSTNIRKGYLLAPGDPTVCFVAGLQEANEAVRQALSVNHHSADPNEMIIINNSDKLAASQEKFARAIKLDEKLFREIAVICVQKLSRPDLAISLAQDNPWRLSYLVGVLSEQVDNSTMIQQLKAEITTQLQKMSKQENVSIYVILALARIYADQGDCDQAIQYYHQALVRDYGQVTWRMELARLLARTGQVDQALHEARICLRLRSNYGPAVKLIENLSVTLPNTN
ncbi:MAG: O-antigen ligase family protein [Sedimentisphaerales bacterium]|nr:O-antigen ligase family protein [Sedimentisphaerales bacterium]